ncbi:hypothetical protein ASPBRDRAFT_654937 [Aspergillus brasiliensis CBS 101740]|uniref:Uncharacterized protein n=1 Tax=Aspergillus brasiliensis (strain CBS 101740 / IMI 381727 / IBT 21946) TaxID=767769 RepID=A0A1L9V0R4_ASPBC|nr:hypothetical protein ASPBRDRAFT_654937 [Aspergillus brasiliensis CBS 101740]
MSDFTQPAVSGQGDPMSDFTFINELVDADFTALFGDFNNWHSAPESGGPSSNTQDPSGQNLPDENLQNQSLPGTIMAQDAGGHGGVLDASGALPDPFVLGSDPDPVASPVSLNTGDHSLAISFENAQMVAMGDNQPNLFGEVEGYNITGPANHTDPSTTGQFNAAALNQTGSVPRNQNMANLQHMDARTLANKFYSGEIAHLSSPMNGVQHTSLSQARNALPGQFSIMPLYPRANCPENNSTDVAYDIDDDDDGENFLQVGDKFLNNASNNFVDPGNYVDNASGASLSSTPVEQAASMIGNVPGHQAVSSQGSQRCTPPSQLIHATGVSQAIATPTNQLDRNRSNTGSSGTSATSQRCQAASPAEQIAGSAGNHVIGNQITGNQITGYTPQHGIQVYQRISPPQQAASGNSSATRSSPGSGSGPQMNSSPPDYLPGKLGTVDGFNQRSSSGSSGFSEQQITPSRGYHMAPAQSGGISESAATIPVVTAAQPTITLQGPVHDPRPSFVPDIERLMNPEAYNMDCSTFYASVDEARAARPVQAGVREDTTLPTNELQKRAIVRALSVAMLSTRKAQDNPGMIKPFKEGKYSEERVEIVCWELLECVITRQISGSLLTLHGLRKKITSDLMTFAERITRVLDCLETQKTICKHLLDPPYMHQFVDDPLAAYKRVIANKTLNKRKGEVMNAGKQVLGAKKAAESTTISQPVRVAVPTVPSMPSVPPVPTVTNVPNVPMVPMVPTTGVTMTPISTPGSIAATGRNPQPATPAHGHQPVVNVMAQGLRTRYNGSMSAGTPTPGHPARPSVPMGHHSAPLARQAAARAHNNRVMGPTSHPRLSAGSVPMPQSAPAYAQTPDTVYNPVRTLGNMMQRNMMGHGNNPVSAQANPHLQMGQANPYMQMGHQQQVLGTVPGVRKRRRQEAEDEDASPSAKRHH